MLDIKISLNKFDLNPDNSIVIGSGVLNALGLRESQDIDLVVSQDKFVEFSQNNLFRTENHYGRDILCSENLEIGTNWQVLGGVWDLSDLLKESIIIEGVRYCKLDFILKVKSFGLEHAKIREKDYPDIKIIEDYLFKVK